MFLFFSLLYHWTNRTRNQRRWKKKRKIKSKKSESFWPAACARTRYLQCTGASFLYHITSHHVFKRGCVPSFVSLFFPPSIQQLSTIPPFYFLFLSKITTSYVYMYYMERQKREEKSGRFDWSLVRYISSLFNGYCLQVGRRAAAPICAGLAIAPFHPSSIQKLGWKKKMYTVKWTKKRASSKVLPFRCIWCGSKKIVVWFVWMNILRWNGGVKYDGIERRACM